MVGNKTFVGLCCALMSAGFIGTGLVLADILPKPLQTPPGTETSRFAATFVGKDQLLTAYQWIRVALLHSPPPSTLIGRDGWLYYRSEAVGDGNSINDFMGRDVPDISTVQRWKAVLEERSDTLRRRGIAYVPVITPNAVTIYPEHLPPEVLRAQGATRADAIVAAMPQVLDLRAVLKARKSQEDVFYASNTHWNDAGAFAGYEAITARIAASFPNVPAYPRTDFAEVPGRRNGEVAFMAGRLVAGEPYAVVYLEPRKEYPARCSDTGEAVLAPGSLRGTEPVNAIITNWMWTDSRCPSRRFVQENPALPKAVVFHDSFMIALGPFLAQSFREVLFVLGPYDQAVVERESPDIVVHEATERYADKMF